MGRKAGLAGAPVLLWLAAAWLMGRGEFRSSEPKAGGVTLATN